MHLSRSPRKAFVLIAIIHPSQPKARRALRVSSALSGSPRFQQLMLRQLQAASSPPRRKTAGAEWAKSNQRDSKLGAVRTDS